MEMLLEGAEKQVDKRKAITEATMDTIIERPCKDNDTLYEQNVAGLDTNSNS